MRGLAVAALAILSAAPAEAKVRTYAVVIGENRSVDRGVAPLAYADDDAAKNFELLSRLVDELSLFSVFDDDTARVHRAAAARAEVPTREALFARLARYDALMAEDKRRGDQPELLFLYAGHGDVDAEGQGYVSLRDGRLTREDLFEAIVGKTEAQFVHVIVDACKSYFFVRSRGGAWKDDAEAPGVGDREVSRFLVERLDRHPELGVVVATSGDQETHEWSRYRGGILSHEIRSALSGAADVNGDGRVEYSEVRAFLVAANARVKNQNVRLDTFARAPLVDRSRAIVDLSRAGRGRRLLFPVGLAGRFSIEDERGVRIADLNKEADTHVTLLVDPAHVHHVRRDEVEELAVAADAPGEVDLGAASWSRVSFAARGALEESFRADLFAVRYGRAFYDAFVASVGEIGVALAEPPVRLAPGATLDTVAVGYVFSLAPGGDAGLSHGASVRYARAFAELDLGLLVEVAYGAGGPTAVGPEELLRVAVLAAARYRVVAIGPLGLRVEAAAGWQLARGRVAIDERLLEGTESKGLRAELGLGLELAVADPIAVYLAGGLALDGLYSSIAPSTSLGPYAGAGLAIRF